MSDDAAVWKLGFGVLVLALCGLTFVMRKHPAPHPPPAAVAPQPPAAIPLPDAAPPEQGDDTAHHLDAANNDARMQRVVATRPQYPFDPRDRWKPRV